METTKFSPKQIIEMLKESGKPIDASLGEGRKGKKRLYIEHIKHSELEFTLIKRIKN